MKYLRLFSSNPGFREINFNKNFNVVVADRSEGSTDKDSRNGLGKSLLIEIINFCLGANPSDTIKKAEIAEWLFSLEVEINSSVFVFTRGVKDLNHIHIQGHCKTLGLEENADGTDKYGLEEFKNALGKILFKLNPQKEQKHTPSYRGLISYFLRTGDDAFSDPFIHFAQQPAWSKKTHNAFLLDLNWQQSVEMLNLQADLKLWLEADKSIGSGILDGFSKNIGELETEKINLKAKLAPKVTKLKNFKVHEQYYEIQEQANSFTQEIHALLNQLNINTRIVKRYSEDIEQEESGNKLKVEDIYKQSGMLFAPKLQKQLGEVEKFHKAVVSNRKQYLASEIDRLNSQIDEDKNTIKELTESKAKYLKILQSHGALEEFSLLQDNVNEQQAKIKEIQNNIDQLRKIEETVSNLRVKVEKLVQDMRRDYDERLPVLESVIKMFNANSEYLYSESGELSVDVGKTGYSYNVKIKKSDSAGISSMKVFCYDLMLAEYWAIAKKAPIALAHDSRIFDGVDERQVAKAIELAMQKADEQEWQYICTINSDSVPYGVFSESTAKRFKQSIVMRLHDKDDNGTLLGMSF